MLEGIKSVQKTVVGTGRHWRCSGSGGAQEMLVATGVVQGIVVEYSTSCVQDEVIGWYWRCSRKAGRYFMSLVNSDRYLRCSGNSGRY